MESRQNEAINTVMHRYIETKRTTFAKQSNPRSRLHCGITH